MVWLASCAVAGALETYAYRFASEPDGMLELAGMAAGVAPAAAAERPQSCFLGAQDEVVDCSAALRAIGVPLQGGWVVWNRSRQLLVARAAMLDQWQVMSLSGFDDQPRQVRTTFEWFRGVEVLEVPGGDRAADASLVLDTRSGCKASGSCESAGYGGRWSMQAEVEPVRSYLDEEIDLIMAPEWSWQEHGARDCWVVNTALSVRAGTRLPVAGCLTGARADRWLLAVSAETIALDGRRRAAMIQRETPAGAVDVTPAEFHAPVRGVVKLAGGWLFRVWCGITQETVASLADGGRLGGADPFAPEVETPAPGIPNVEVPPHLAAWAAGRMSDMRESLRRKGISLGPDDAVLYDMQGQRLLACCREAQVLDLLEQLFGCCISDVPWNIRSETWLGEQRGEGGREVVRAFVAGRSGQRAMMKWRRGEACLLDCEVEPTIGTSEGIVDLRWAFEAAVPPGGRWRRNATLTLQAGRDFVADGGRMPDGRQWRYGLRVTVLGSVAGRGE